MVYTCVFAVLKLLIAFYIPYKAAFEQEPTWGSVYFDIFIGLMFFADIIITFNKPLYDEKSRLVVNRKIISIKYLRSWFLVDLIVCFPVTYFHKLSTAWPRSKDDALNLVQLNFASIPRFYKLAILFQLVRLRGITDQITYCLKKLQLDIRTQSIFHTCYTLALLLQIAGCCWRLLTDFNLDTSKSWLRSAHL